MSKQHRIETALEEVVMDALRERNLDEPIALADALGGGMWSIYADNVLRRSHWDIETSCWLIDELDLPILVVVRRKDRI